MSNITYQVESFSKILDELKILFELHWNELNPEDDYIYLNPDYNKFIEMEKVGFVHTTTVRDGSVLIGYIISIVQPHLHFMHINTAYNDAIYLDPEYRGGKVIIKLFKTAEDDLIEKGVDMITMHTKKRFDFGRLLEKMGYAIEETVYRKMLRK